MRIIKLNATESTNTFLRQLSSDSLLEDFTTVVAEFQSKGKGQMGSVWASESAKNLMFSSIKDISFLSIEHSFYLSMVSSLSVRRALEKLNIPKLAIKWPNDILSENKKICGILIENIIKQGKLKATIIGVGLNVNQSDFQDLPQASSLLVRTGKLFDLDEILYLILDELKYYFQKLEADEYGQVYDEYHSYLFRKNKPSTFQDAEGSIFTGIITSVSPDGNLQVLLEDEKIKGYEVKEIKLLY
ncbi:biotin--[Mangrovimonas sp. AS39]|uniref:biotin--[acetyl-CoA-carboxylase] ligase n=1 Tax=Mangrovimonas futianensis TaxID=2895523 RepID=UPI001E5A5019|nr:biotin--[acetyl-CoA-carboxylase] ligase [Mangrovimonas futianensis]MCF1192564.1 biotin--[acetyl-CoA-carboxylase] ligase [Mangrovimonas futianensis]MCF1196106.1 biotin--[acetyl-CoA-carboxylase] ligase [Mangrovimonas futianensis]